MDRVAQLHEEPLKTFEQRTTALAESSLNLVSEALALLRSQARESRDGTAIAQPELRAEAHTAGTHPSDTIVLFVAPRLC